MSVRALAALTFLIILSHESAGQDSAGAARPPLPLDTSRIRPFQREYEIIVHTRDSTVVIGRREVNFVLTTYSGAPAWLLVETRSGVVPAVDSLYLGRDLRPIHWSSALGVARLGAEFVGDSIYGATTAPTGRQNIVIRGRTDLIVSTAMMETLLPLLPLAPAWRDSVGVLAIDLSSSIVTPGEVTVTGEEDLRADGSAPRPSWVVVLRTEFQSAIYWIDKQDGAAMRIDQSVLPHVGTSLEYRAHSARAASPP